MTDIWCTEWLDSGRTRTSDHATKLLAEIHEAALRRMGFKDVVVYGVTIKGDK